MSLASPLTRVLLITAGLFTASGAQATLIVNSPRPIEYQVKVQLIRTAHDDGSPLATAFGSASQRAYIESRVNDVWAQAGIQVDFADSIQQLNSTTAYGSASSVDQLVTLGYSAGVLSNEPFTLNLFLVNKVPGYTSHAANSSAGLARVSGNGIALFVGTTLLGSNNGRDVIAKVAAHEIGHNLGLTHVSTAENLLASGGGARLTTQQISQVLNSFFVQPLPTLAGDFNGDGSVDAADYSAWRDGLGTLYSQQDYRDWRENFGKTQAPLASSNSSLPEPTALALLAAVLAGLVARR
ncbi:MAG: hypothetical protein KDA37_09740 [Planctomycetales bacterium]|nr:hypothetical protein [Planctomycetales bacterium]